MGVFLQLLATECITNKNFSVLKWKSFTFYCQGLLVGEGNSHLSFSPFTLGQEFSCHGGKTAKKTHQTNKKKKDKNKQTNKQNQIKQNQKEKMAAFFSWIKLEVCLSLCYRVWVVWFWLLNPNKRCTFPVLNMHRKLLLNSDHLVAPELGIARSDRNVKQLLLLQPISFLASSSLLPPVHYSATEWIIFGVRLQNDSLVGCCLNCSTKSTLGDKRHVTFSSPKVSLCCVPLACSLLAKISIKDHKSHTIWRYAFSKRKQ